jgi:hypothetical protein
MGQAKQRQAQINELKAQGPKLKAPRSLKHAAFFYSPKDTIKAVLSISFGPRENELPLELTKFFMDPEYMARQDEEFAKDPSMKDDYFEQLDWMLNEVQSNPGHMMTTEEMSRLAIMAGNIYWLTERGFIKQSEYNGTMFVY